MPWSEEARRAAAEARRRKRRPKRPRKPKTVRDESLKPARKKGPKAKAPQQPKKPTKDEALATGQSLGPFDPTKIPKAGSKPPVFDFEPPPPPKGKPGQRRAGGFTASGHTNTRLGDLAEAVVQQLGMKSLLPEGRRQNPLDVEWDSSGYGFEVKAVTPDSTEYKVKMKSHEVGEKRKYAEEHGLTPALMIVVMDIETGTAHAYWREGIANGRLTEEWNFMGRAGIL